MMGIANVKEIWRVLKDANLEAIRREAERAFQVLIVSEAEGDAEALAVLLTGESDGSRHPWLLVERSAAAPRAAASALVDLAVLVLRHSDAPDTLAALQRSLQNAKLPTVVVVSGVTSRTAAIVRAGEAGRVAVAALDSDAVGTIATALLAAVAPTARLALARHLPPLRDAVFHQIIDETARANASYALATGLAEIVPVFDLPLNLADIVVLTKNQLVMSYRLALAAGKTGSARDLIGEVLGVIGGGFLFRQASRQLIGLIPGAGIVPKVAIAYAGTWAVGRAVAAWAVEGKRLSRRAVQSFYKEAWQGARAFAEGMVEGAKKSRPARRLFRRRATKDDEA